MMSNPPLLPFPLKIKPLPLPSKIPPINVPSSKSSFKQSSTVIFCAISKKTGNKITDKKEFIANFFPTKK